ncbi:MAG: putative minor capsid protein [Bacillota bacterium]
MAKPIPLKLLFHSVVYREYKGGNDGWDGSPGSYAEPITIENIRVEPITVIARNNVRDDTEGQSVVFIDRANSKPFLNPVERSKMSFDGIDYEVNNVKAYYDENPHKPHHYEVILK